MGDALTAGFFFVNIIVAALLAYNYFQSHARITGGPIDDLGMLLKTFASFFVLCFIVSLILLSVAGSVVMFVIDHWIWFAGIAVVIGVLGKMGSDTDDKNEESTQAEERNEAEDKNENE